MTEAGWTRTKPTEPGWYWFRQELGAETVVAVNNQIQVLFMLTPNALTGKGTTGAIPVDLLGGEWQGPIAPNEVTE